MALHHRLSTWQRIFLGILCFPLLPIYLCVYCLCIKPVERKKTEDQTADRPGPSTRFSTKVYTIDVNSEVQQSQQKTISEVEIFDQTADKPGPSTRFSTKDQITDKPGPSTHFSTKVSIIDENSKGQQNQKKTRSAVVKFKYPWDRSNLKSMEIDLNKFRELDSYASKLEPRGSLQQLTQQLLQNAYTDLEKTRAIWIWICHHIEYDVIGYKDTSQRSCDPDDVFRTRKGVCAGYSQLFKEMCSIAGVKCEKINGYAKGIGYKLGQKIPKESNHAWNMVYLEDCWHLLDSTWGAGQVNNNASSFTFEYNEYYFLTHPALLIGDHYPDQAEWQLLEPTVSRKHFEDHVSLKSGFYKAGLVSCHPETGVIETVKGKVTINIEGHQNTLFLFDLDGNKKNGVMKLLNCGMKLDVYPQETGQHKLQLFAKQQDSENTYHFALEYRIDCNSVNTRMEIPQCLHNPVGPSWETEAYGLVEPSHPDPIINTENGCCTICFTLKQDLSFLCSLHSDEVQMTPEKTKRHVFVTQTKGKLEIKVRVPRSGTYVLQIFAKPRHSKSTSYDYLCNYLIICTNPSVKWPVFPLQYNNWAEHYKLVEPLDGVLPNNTNVSFKLLIPDVATVFIDGEKNISLTLSEDGYWVGNCSTTNREKLQVNIEYKNSPNTWYGILKYDVTGKS
ncbi:kyphoscoliosis peptidase-like [Pyxicephalus adspersus]